MARSWRGVTSKSTARDRGRSAVGSHLVARADLAPQRAQVRRHRLGDRLRAAAGHRPAGGVSQRQQHEREGRRGRTVEGAHRVRAHTGEEAAGALAPEGRVREPHRSAHPRPRESGREQGWRGGRGAPRTISARSSQAAANGPTSAAYASPSRPPRPAAWPAPSGAGPPRGRRRADGPPAPAGSIISSPWAASGSVRRNGEPTASGWIAEHTSWRYPGSVSSAVAVPPPTCSDRSHTSTERPARASSMAAARPFGPAPTTTASGNPSAAPPERPGDQANGCSRHIDAGAYPGVVPDVHRLRPLAAAIDADALHRHLARRRPGASRARAACAANAASSLPCPPIVIPSSYIGSLARISTCAWAWVIAVLDERAERDPAGEHVPLRCHQRERLVVGVEHQHAGRELEAAGHRQVERGHLARGDPGQRREEPVALRPELGEVRLPDRRSPAPGSDRPLRARPGRSSATSGRSPGSARSGGVRRR